MRKRKPLFGLQTTIAAFACIVVAVALMVTDLLISNKEAKNTHDSLAAEAMEMARIVSKSTVVIEALNGQRDQKEIQVYAEQIRKVSGVRFIVVLDMNRIRKSHPTPSKIGEYYAEHDVDPVFTGRENTSIETGSLGRSLRAFSPVFTPAGKQVGVVLVGIMLDSVETAVSDSRSSILVGIICGLLVGMIGALVLAQNIKKIMFGMEPFAIAKLLEERSAMLQSVREGVIAVDKDSRLTIVNGEALRLFQQVGIQNEVIGKPVEEYVPNTRLQNVLTTGEAELDQEQELNGITVVANRIPVSVDGEIVGAIATFRDKTEMRHLAEKLTGVKNYAEALRSQSHEFMNKLHVILGMIRLECYDQLKIYVNQIAQQYQVEVGSVVKKIKDPVLAGFLLGKLSRARELGVEMVLADECSMPDMSESEMVHDLITIIGNLLDNALEAVERTEVKTIKAKLIYNRNQIVIEVSDTGAGIDKEQQERIFVSGYSTKGLNRGLGLYLTKGSVERLNGKIAITSEIGKGTSFKVVLPYNSKERYFD